MSEGIKTSEPCKLVLRTSIWIFLYLTTGGDRQRAQTRDSGSSRGGEIPYTSKRHIAGKWRGGEEREKEEDRGGEGEDSRHSSGGEPRGCGGPQRGERALV